MEESFIIMPVMVVIKATQKTSDNISLNEMEHKDSLDRRTIMGLVKSYIKEEQFQRRRDLNPLRDGFSAENFFFSTRHHTTQQWNFNKNAYYQKGKGLIRYLGTSTRNPPYDLCLNDQYMDIKTIFLDPDEPFCEIGQEMVVPVTPEQRLMCRYFLVYLVKISEAGADAPGAVIVNYKLLFVRNLII